MKIAPEIQTKFVQNDEPVRGNGDCRRFEEEGVVHMSYENPNIEEELQGRGMYKQAGTWYGVPYTPIERLTPPISPADNLLAYYFGGRYEWIPDMSSDQIDLTPFCNRDAEAQGYDGGYDAFGVKWVPSSSTKELPAFVEEGLVTLEDVADWQDLEWPDVDSWEWSRDADIYNETYEDDDRLRRGIIYSGYFERLISLMGFEGAAVSLLEDPESVSDLFKKLTELNIQILDHYMDDFGCRSIMMHDDWSAKRSPFFSLEVASELLAPNLKDLVDYAHSRGAAFTLHSCGNGVALVPAMKMAGPEAWQMQEDCIDMDAAYEACGDDIIIEQYPVVPDGLQGDELEAYIRGMMERFCVKHKGFIEFADYDPERWPTTRRLVYKIGREMVLESRKAEEKDAVVA